MANEKNGKERMPLSKVKEYFKMSKKNFTDEQLLAIRDFLYEWAEINYRIYTQVMEREAQFEEKEEEQFKNAA